MQLRGAWGCISLQGNIQDSTSLLPAVATGTALVVTEVISQLIPLLSGAEQTATGAQGDYDNWTCSRTLQQRDTAQSQLHRSFDTFLPVDPSTRNMRVQPQSLPLTSELMKMETDFIAGAMSGFKKACTCIAVCETRKKQFICMFFFVILFNLQSELLHLANCVKTCIQWHVEECSVELLRN
jgi:hypothetical protein